MNRYIDADKLYKEIEQLQIQAQNAVDSAVSMVARMIDATKFSERDYFASLVRCMPTADVAPVVHGYWLHENNPNTDIYEHRPLSICSECGHTRVGDRPYCSECGAKMDGERREKNERINRTAGA